MDGTEVSETRDLTPQEDSAMTATQLPDDPAEEQGIAAAAGAGEPGSPGGTDGEVDGASLMEQFLSDPSHDYKTLKYGDVMDGIIMHIDRDEILVDIGSKSEGIVPAKEYQSL